WLKALDTLRQTPPDLDKCAKEAVSAVEQLARILTGQPAATLGKCIKALRDSKKVQSPLLQGIEELWIWANQEPGVRHGGSAAGGIAPVEAEYAVKVAEAALLLLLSVDAA
ncbi:MAG: hypothetical protein Q8R92_15950, partial [Deltaproteobacteria bacterium]|nr:hypothetical protein [Deltaproteobacteria bacterium]